MTDNNNDTSAPVSPDDESPDSGVKKLSQVPTIIACVAGACILGFIFFSVMQKKAAQYAVAEEEEEQITRAATDSELNSPSATQEKILAGIDYGISAPAVPEKTELPPTTIRTEGEKTIELDNGQGRIPERIQTIPANDPIMQMEADPRIADFARQRTLLFKQAIKAPMSVEGISAKDSMEYRKKTAANLPPKPDENASYEEKMAYYNAVQAQIRQKQNQSGAGSYEDKVRIAKSMLGIEDDTPSSSAVSVSPAQQAAKGSRDWDLHEGVQKSKGSLIISTGFVIPGIMISGINSDLPNSIIAQVSQNVYDSLTGQNLLIPQGTRIFGTFASQIKYGQERVFVVWDRLIFPNGETLTLEKMPGSDVSGYSGFTDQVNNHFWKLFKHAFLLSIVSGVVSYSEHHYDKHDGNDQTASGAMAESFGQQMGATTTKIIEKHLDIQPTLEIRPGYQFNIIVNKDIRFSRAYRR